jgi:uncharacterized protein
MRVINVATRFTLNLASGARRAFEAGRHEVEEAVADHWFVKAHLAREPAAAVALEEAQPQVVEFRIADSDAVAAALAEAAAQLDKARSHIEDLEAQVAGMAPRDDLAAAQSHIAELEAQIEALTSPSIDAKVEVAGDPGAAEVASIVDAAPPAGRKGK